MKKFKHLKQVLTFAFGALIVSSCVRELTIENQKLNLSTPIASTSLSLENFVAPENYVLNEEGQIHLVYDLDIYSSYPIDYLEIPNREDFHKASLETIRLSNTALEADVTLAQAYPPAQILNGQTVNVPALELDNVTKVDVDANTFFESALLESGKMFLKVVNGFPVELAYMKFVLSNKSDNAEVAEMEFFNIKPGETQIDSADMTGIYAEGLMIGELVRVETVASDTPVLIRAKDAVNFEVSVKDLKAFEAKAVFPAQDVIDIDLSWDYDFGGPEITEMSIAEGTLFMQVESNVDETIFVTFELPALIDDGDTVVQNFEVPPATSGNPYSETKTVSLAGYDVILKGKRGEGWTETNSFHNRLVARIDSSGELKRISKNDSITLYIGLLDIKPSYVRGYLGKDTFSFGPEKQSIDVFRKLDGILDIKDLNMQLLLENSSGLDAKATFKEIGSINKQGGSVLLTSSILDNEIEMNRATDPSTPFVKSYDFNSSNSNVDEFIENLPVDISYSLDLDVNPNGNVANFNDFVYSTSEIKASVVLDIPMNVEPKNLSMVDTFNVSFESFTDVENLGSLNLNLIVYNGYPYTSNVDFILLDENDLPIDTLFNNETVALPGLLPDFGDKITEPSKTVFTESLNNDQLDRIVHSKKAIVVTRFNSNAVRAYTLYDSYSIDIKLTTDIDYTITTTD
ncbi:MAG: hypothetical protein JXQ87_07115 [Bacteroidia bacterium]